MNQFYQQFIEQLLATSLLEWLAVILAIAYLLLAIKESLWCWPAAFLSTAIYIFLFFDVSLYMESLLNLYYLVMAVFGWQQWKKNKEASPNKPIFVWPLRRHLFWVAIISLLVVFSAFLLDRYTDQQLALIDSFTTWFAILATYMVTQKVLENWLYWIVIDSVSIYLYISKGFALTSVLFIIYIVLAILGWMTWKKNYEQQSSAT
ncbi:MAG: nicotinamide riboside transporter PnuC [Kangiellaceae bacterium]|nr:nicotinamide riboside transporter PnuC [Kangiellaceae bacterium]